MASKDTPDRRSDVPASLKPAAWLIKAPNRPDNTQTGEATADALYQAVGRVLSAWEHLETLMAIFFGDLCSSESHEQWAPVRAYGAIATSSARADMIEAAAAQAMPADAVANLQTFMLDFRAASSLRNIVAHGMVIYVEAGNLVLASPDHPSMKPPFYLVTPPYNTRKSDRQLMPEVAFSAAEIRLIEAEIIKLQKRYVHNSVGMDGGLVQFGIRLHSAFPKPAPEPAPAKPPRQKSAKKPPPTPSAR